MAVFWLRSYNVVVRQVHSLLHQALAALVVLILALLLPLACILHCAFAQAAAREPRAADGVHFFICMHTAGHNEHAAPAPLNPQLVRALFELAPTLALILLPALVVRYWLRPRSIQQKPLFDNTPPTPPPRFA